tara:strand:- start:1898 stop:4516 length:2619 start_codon:yes stop_codon:yes gene_type:complete
MKKILLATTFLTCGLIPTVAQADPATAIALISAAFTTAGAGFTWTVFAKAFVTNLALGYALNALVPKPSGLRKGYTVNTLGSAQPTAVIYGKVKVGGVIFYQETTNDNKYLHSLIALAGHEVQQIEKVYLNDEEVTINGSGNVTAPTKYASKVRIKLHLGADDQAADATLASESSQWGVDHKASGIAYIYTRFEFDADAFPNGVPQVTALVQGKKVVQTGSSTGAYSANSARCLADYLVYSGIATYDEIDSSLFTTATSVCDENVTLSGGGTEKRYECNGTFTTDSAPKEVISGMLASMGGMLWYSQGKWKMKAAAFTNPVLNLDENDLVSALSIKTRNSRRDGFNKIVGTFRGEQSNWQTTNYPAVTSTVFLGVDNNQENTVELNFPFISNSPQAQRIAKIALYRNREQLSVSGVYGLRALQLTVGDIIRLKNERLGFKDPDDSSLGKLFEVVDWSFGLNSEMSLQCNMVLQEISSGIFDWDADETLFETNNTTLPSPFFVPDIGITLGQELRIVNEHVVNVLTVTTTASANETSQVDKVEVEYKEQSESDFKSLGTGKLGLFEILDLEASTTGTTYDVRARAINSLGVKGTYASKSVVFLPEATPPANVTNFSFSISSGTLFLKWTPVADLDLSYYQVKHNSLTSGATWDNSSFDPIGIEKIARPATSAALPALSGTYLIKAYDKTGNESVAATSFVITALQLPALGVSSTLTENPSFSGTKSNLALYTTANPDELRITNFTATGSSGVYEFNSKIDLTTSRTATVSSEVVFTRHQSTTLWDAIPQNWDTWPDNFDNWTNADVGFNDNIVSIQVAATNDDPNSGSATFGSFTDANGSQIVGRGFKFKATLSNTNPNVTPSISVLKGTVGY